MSAARIRPELPRLMPGEDEAVARAATSQAAASTSRGPRPRVTLGAIATLGMIVMAPEAPAQAPPTPGPRPERTRLEAVVRKLASPELEGRRGEGGRKAASYLIEEFRRLGLEPLFAGQFVQEIPSGEPGRIQGRNVGAALRGSNAGLRDQWVILAGHYDHLGVRDGVLYPGADDNATGVAMMLEVARCLKTTAEKARRSVMFVGFDLEEVGLFGSRYFASHPPVPLKSVSLFITADMIGRALGGICEKDVFVLGTEHAPGLRPWVEAAARDRPVKVNLLGSDVLVLNRSDYGPFRNRQIPFLFFSTGENPRYHSPEDTPETVDFAKLTAISRVIHDVTTSAAGAQSVPRWSDVPDYPLAEALAIRDVLRQLLDHRESLGLGAAQLFLMNGTLKTLEGIIGRGVMTPSERAGVIQAARIVLLTIH